MYAYWKLWVDVLNIGLDAQHVIAMRLAKIAKGGAAAEAECRRMVSEKFLAAAAARDAAAAALVGGKGIDTAARKKSASVFVATMLGALTISRIVADPKVSNEILAAARAKLSSWE